MILLIQRLDIFAIDTALIFKFHYDSINSRKEFEDKAEIGVFKFHYDSINSENNDIRFNRLYVFKFHYDSINSKLKKA